MLLFNVVVGFFLLGGCVAATGGCVCRQCGVQVPALFVALLAANCVWNAATVGSGFGNKYLTDNGFPFPLCIALVHAIVTQAVCLLWRSRLPPHDIDDLEVFDRSARSQRLVRTVVASSLCSTLTLCLAVMAISRMDATLFVVCKGSTAAMQYLVGIAMGLETSTTWLWIPVFAVCVGTGMAAAGDMQFDAIGVAMVLASTVASAWEWAFNEMIVQSNVQFRDPFAVLYMTTPIGVVLICLATAVMELPTILAFDFTADTHSLLLRSPIRVVFAATVAASLGLLGKWVQLYLATATSVLSMQVMGAIRNVVAFFVGAVVFHEALGPLNVAGFVITLVASSAYGFVRIHLEQWTPSDATGYERLPNAVITGTELGGRENAENVYGAHPDGHGDPHEGLPLMQLGNKDVGGGGGGANGPMPLREWRLFASTHRARAATHGQPLSEAAATDIHAVDADGDAKECGEEEEEPESVLLI